MERLAWMQLTGRGPSLGEGTAGGTVTCKGAAALLIGGSQSSVRIKEGTDLSETEMELRKRKYVPRKAWLTEIGALPDILLDVQTFRNMLAQLSDVEMMRPFVGRNGSGALTRGLFLNKLETLVGQRGAHGACVPGAFVPLTSDMCVCWGQGRVYISCTTPGTAAMRGARCAWRTRGW